MPIPVVISLVLLLGLFGLLAWRNLVAALALLIAILPAYLIRFSIPLPILDRGGIPTTLLELLLLVLFAVWFVRRDRTPRPGHDLRYWAYGMTLLAIGATIGIAISPVPVAAAGLWRAYILEPYLFFIMFVDIVRGAEERKTVLAALGSLVAVIGATAIFQKFTGYGIPNPYWQAEETRRATSVFGFPNAIGLLSAPVVALMAGWSFCIATSAPDIRRRCVALLPLLSAVLGSLGILYAVSEGAMVGLLAGLFVLGLLTKRTRIFTVTAAVLVVIVTLSVAPLRDYAIALATLSDDSGSVRVIVWNGSLRMLHDRPVFGAGLSGYPTAMAPYHDAPGIEIFQYPHSLLLNFWSETGLLGVAGFLLILLAFAAISWRLLRARPGEWLPAAVVAAMAALLVHGLVDVPYFKNDLALLFWVLVGLLESMRREAGLAVARISKES
jgi:putative inorganic carbon (HCO3(-)) transporter